MARAPKPAPRRVTIDRMSQSLERTLRAEGKSEKTVYSYTLSVRLLRDFLGKRKRDLTVDVSRDDIRDFIADQTKKNSEATALVRFKSLQQFFRHCVEEDELDESPMAGMRAPKVETAPVPVVSDAVLKRAPEGPGRRHDGGQAGHGPAPGLLGHRLPPGRGHRPAPGATSTWATRPMTVRGKGNRLRVVTLRGQDGDGARPIPAPA